MDVFRSLLSVFGPQGWWPITRPGDPGPSYDPLGRRSPLSPAQKFEIAVGALLTQNTAWTNVEKALANLIAARALSPEAIAALPDARLHKLIRPSGYFRQKTRRLKNLCRFLLARWDGRIDRFLDRPTAQVREELLSLNGVGPETADSILLYAGGHPVFVVDAYTRRIGRRLGLFRTSDYHEVQRYFSSRLVSSEVRAVPAPSAGTVEDRRWTSTAALFNEYHALIVALGKGYCRKTSPRCGSCPLRDGCRGASAQGGSHA